MKTIIKTIATSLALCAVLNLANAQQKKATTAKKPSSYAPAAKPKATTITNTSTSAIPAQSTKPPQQPEKAYEPQKSSSDFDNYNKNTEPSEDFGRVIKLNFANMIVGGISLDFENRLSNNHSFILSGGYYTRGVLKGNYRAGADYRVYLGKSKAPSGIFASIGAMSNFFKYTSADTGEKINLTFMNIRALFGYQVLSGHFTFEGAVGPGFGVLLSNDTGAEDAKIPLGILPSAKLSIGYAF